MGKHVKFYTNFYMRGDYVVIRGYDNGERFEDRIKYKPTLYVPSKKEKIIRFNHKCLERTITGKPIEPIQFDSIKESRDFKDNYDKIDGFQIFGSNLYDYVCVHQNYSNNYDPDHIRIINIDIEVGSADGFPEPKFANQEVTAITCSLNGIYYTFGVGEYNVKSPNVNYFNCENEEDLLKKFLLQWKKFDADIITGWNVQGFDLPYLYNRIPKILPKKYLKMLSPSGIIKEREYMAYNREQFEVVLVGTTILDYLELYKKFTYSQQESYRLDHIAHVELGENKLDYSEVETLHQLYKLDFDKFIDYNIKDVELVDRLENKMKLIDMALAIAYDAKVCYRDVFTQVRMWDVLIHNWLYDRNIAIPPKKANFKGEQFAGAYVKNPQVGAHDWVMSFDLNSLYPHLIMQYNISPDTFIENESVEISVDDLLFGRNPQIRNDVCMAGNGALFDRKKRGFLPEMMNKMYNDRVIAKQKMLEAEELLEQVNRRLNGEYSTLGNIANSRMGGETVEIELNDLK
jgi:DNA polymerase elongation subunit (family B)